MHWFSTHDTETRERRQDPKTGQYEELQLNIYDSDDNAEIKNQPTLCERATGEELYKKERKKKDDHLKTPPGYHFANNSKPV